MVAATEYRTLNVDVDKAVKHTYVAMLKDAPTVQEVDLQELKKDLIRKVNKNQCFEFIVADTVNEIIKHGKLYAVKGG